MYESGQAILIKGHNLIREITRIEEDRCFYKGMFYEGECLITDIECIVTACLSCGKPIGGFLECDCNPQKKSPDIIFEVASKEEIICFLDKWLVNYRSLKLDAKAVELVEKLTPYFHYEGEMHRGLFEPYLIVQRAGVERCIDSWSKTSEGIAEMEELAECGFGSVSVMDGSIHVHTEEEFIQMNEEASSVEFDKVLIEHHVGLDLSKLAEFVGYRADFLSRIQAVEEVLVIRKAK